VSIKRWIPWNCFKREDEDDATSVPVQRSSINDQLPAPSGSLAWFHQQIERLFDQA
jgi:HSP20 family protein